MSRMLKQAGLKRQPAHGSFELTYRCNLSCRMCYARKSPGDVDCGPRSSRHPPGWTSPARRRTPAWCS